VRGAGVGESAEASTATEEGGQSYEDRGDL